MLSGRDMDLEAGQTFLHFISGMRASCRGEGRRHCLTLAFEISLALRIHTRFIKASVRILSVWMPSEHESRYLEAGKPQPQQSHFSSAPPCYNQPLFQGMGFL